MYRKELKEYFLSCFLPDGRFNWHVTRKLKKDVLPKELQEIKESLLLETKYLPEESSIRERIFHILNDIYDLHKCLECGNHTTWEIGKQKYTKFCSVGCASKNEKTKASKGLKKENHPRWGKQLSEEVKEKIRKSNLGKKASQETINKLKEKAKTRLYTEVYTEERNLKISKALKGRTNYWSVGKPSWNKGIPCTEEAKTKIRKTHIQRIKDNYGICFPGYNETSCEFFKLLDSELNTSGQYAKYGGGEYEVTELGYFIDYFNKNLKIIIEWDEPYHFLEDGSLRKKDTKREERIKKLFNEFIFIRVKHSEDFSTLLSEIKEKLA